jgi:putative FmdB family regulatory protein
MPIYKYECEACNHVFEDLRGFSDPDPEACPDCQAQQIRRLITGGNFQLKGGGWYVTEYGSSGSGGSSSSDDGGSKATSTDSSDGTEAA